MDFVSNVHADVVNTGLQSGVQGGAGAAMATAAIGALVSGPGALSVSGSIRISNSPFKFDAFQIQRRRLSSDLSVSVEIEA